MYLQNIFDKEPIQWGLRGDPYMWKELKHLIRSKNFPKNEIDFINLLNNLFMEITGFLPEKNKNYFVEKFNYGGMSSGHISSDFWIEIGFPLLIERFKLLKIN